MTTTIIIIVVILVIAGLGYAYGPEEPAVSSSTTPEESQAYGPEPEVEEGGICPLCGAASLSSWTGSYALQEGQMTITYENVPQTRCSNCGNTTYSI